VTSLLAGLALEVVDQIRDLGWQGVFGNTDEAIARPDALEEFAAQSTAPRSLWELAREMTAFTREALGDERTAWLGALPRVVIHHLHDAMTHIYRLYSPFVRLETAARVRTTNSDMTLTKSIPLGSEKRVLKLQAQAYNVFNHTEINGLGTGAQYSFTTNQLTNGSTLGYETSANPNRVMAFTVRVVF